MKQRLRGVSFLKMIKLTIEFISNSIFKNYYFGRTLAKNIIMNLNIENYKRMQKEKVVQSFYSVHNAAILIGKNVKCGAAKAQHVAWPKTNTIKLQEQLAGYG